MRLSTELDATDIAILVALQTEGRIALGALSERVGLSAPAVAERVRKLEERRVISGYSARVDPGSLALDIAAFIQVRVSSSTIYPEFIAHAEGHPEVMECHAITGEASHILKIRTHNTASLETLLGEIQRWPGVVSTRTNLVLSTHKETAALPLEYARNVVIAERSPRRRTADPLAKSSSGRRSAQDGENGIRQQ